MVLRLVNPPTNPSPQQFTSTGWNPFKRCNDENSKVSVCNELERFDIQMFFFFGGVVGWVSEVRVGFFFGWINKYRSTELNNMNNMQTLKVVSFPSKEARSSK